MRNGTLSMRRASVLLLSAAAMVVLTGCGGAPSQESMEARAWTPPRGLVIHPGGAAQSNDPEFQAWLASRNEWSLNPEPAIADDRNSWVEIDEWDRIYTVNGRVRDNYRRTTRTWQSGSRR